MIQRSAARLESRLPEFILGDAYTTQVGDSPREKKVVEVTCPRRDCGRTFIVLTGLWWRSRPGFVGRSCPYCFKTARLPKKP